MKCHKNNTSEKLDMNDYRNEADHASNSWSNNLVMTNTICEGKHLISFFNFSSYLLCTSVIRLKLVQEVDQLQILLIEE